MKIYFDNKEEEEEQFFPIMAKNENKFKKWKKEESLEFAKCTVSV